MFISLQCKEIEWYPYGMGFIHMHLSGTTPRTPDAAHVTVSYLLSTLCHQCLLYWQVFDKGVIQSKPSIAWWTVILGAAGFATGILLLGGRTIDTVGNKLSSLTPSKSFGAQVQPFHHDFVGYTWQTW